ncbi:hypothetical protein BCR44DRAFT_47222 [Catenaria anguillulae PL171]|uniref:Muniscin C-terminal mu homology domain-domain-containing protein n=1 Tax=Catenaria anguillulae PL171 TaxID=765915 RepID=A0A1Y2HMX7_9FUNG|nr:hypothetical protein BCR44DRAFT_47222 [Catenaria anguillulae PL171]
MAAVTLPPPIATAPPPPPPSAAVPPSSSAGASPAPASTTSHATESDPNARVLASEFLKLEKPSAFINPVVERVLRHKIHTESLLDCLKEIAQIHDAFGKALLKTLSKYHVDDLEALGVFHKPHLAFRQTLDQVAHNACNLGASLTPECDKLREANNQDGWKNIRKLESRSSKAAKNYEDAAAKLDAGNVSPKPLPQKKMDKLREKFNKEKKQWVSECHEVFKAVQHLDSQVAASTAQLLSKVSTTQEAYSRSVVEAAAKLTQEAAGLNQLTACQHLVSIIGGGNPPSPLKPLKRSWGITRSPSISGAVSPDGGPGHASLSRDGTASPQPPSALSPIVDQDGYRVRPEDADKPPVPLKAGDSDDSIDTTVSATGKLKIQIGGVGATMASAPPLPGSSSTPPPPLPMRRPTQQSIGDNMGMSNAGPLQPSEPVSFSGTGASSWAANSAFNTLQPIQAQRTGGSTFGMGTAFSTTMSSTTFGRPVSNNSSPFSPTGDVGQTTGSVPATFPFSTATQMYPSLAMSPPQNTLSTSPLIVMSPLAVQPTQSVPMVGFPSSPARVKVRCQEQLKILCLDQQVLKLMVGGQLLLNQSVPAVVPLHISNPRDLQMTDRSGSSQSSKSFEIAVQPSDPPQQLLLHYQGAISSFDLASLPVSVSLQVYHCDPTTNEIIVSLTWRTNGDFATKVDSITINSVGTGATCISNPHGAIPDSVTQSLVWHNPTPGGLTVRYKVAENGQQKVQAGLQVNAAFSTERSLSGIVAENMDCKTVSVAKLCVFRFTKVSPMSSG